MRIGHIPATAKCCITYKLEEGRTIQTYSTTDSSWRVDRIDRRALTVLETLTEAGFDAWLVGGAVRDNLLGRALHDYDVTTDAKPEEVIALFGNSYSIPTGIKHGTVTVLSDKLPVEVTTFRQDGGYQGHRRPRKVHFSNRIENDMARRDFTVNALAWSPLKGLFDPYGGLADLKSGVLRAVGKASERFDEDALRILRGLRLSAELQLTVEEKTASAINEQAHLLRHISQERITQEIRRIILADVQRVWSDFLPVWLNVFPALREVPEAVCKAVNWQPLLQLPAIDRLRKPTFFLLLTQCVLMPEYQATPADKLPVRAFMETDADSLREMLSTLRLSNEESKQILYTAGAIRDTLWQLLHYRPSFFGKERPLVPLTCGDRQIPRESVPREFEYTDRYMRYGMRRIIGAFGEEAVETACDILKVLLSEDYAAECWQLQEIKTQILSSDVPYKVSDLAIDGNDLLRYGLRSGRAVGEMLRSLLEEVMSENIPNEPEALRTAARNILRYR